MSEIIRYYAFFDSRRRTYYFHDPISNKVVWDLPENADAFFAENLKPFIPPKTEERISLKSLSATGQPHRKSRGSNHIGSHNRSRADLLSQTQFQTSPRPRKNTQISLSTSLLRFGDGIINPTNESEIYYPPSMNEDKTRCNTREFMTANFKTYQKGSFMKKESIYPDELFQADKHMTCYPLLKATDHKRVKEIGTIVQFIQNYSSNPTDFKLSTFTTFIDSHTSLIDEAYMLILKQTRNNTSVDKLHRTWDILICMCTLFLPTKAIQDFVKTLLAQSASESNKRIAHPAQLAYLRFIARCSIGENLRKMPPNWIDGISRHRDMSYFTIGASLYELLWFQRRTLPLCPLPLFMHKCCETLFKLGATETEGTFRLPGNKAQIDELVIALDSGEDIFDEIDLMNLASIFKMWLRELPESIVPPRYYPELIECHGTKNYLPLLDKLPRANRETLAYLIGFLKRFIDGADKTHMSVTAVCMIFGQNVLRIDVANQEDARMCNEIGRCLMEQLIREWDVSFVYPLPQQYLQAA